MDRLIERLSQVVAQNNDYINNGNSYNDPKQSHLFYPQCSKVGFCANLRNLYTKSDICENSSKAIVGINSVPIISNDSLQKKPYFGSFKETEIPRNSSRPILNDSFEMLESFSNKIEHKISQDFGPKSESSRLYSNIISNLSATKFLPGNNFKQVLKNDEEKKTASNIAMKYSPEDIILSKVRGIFMTCYSRDSINCEQSKTEKLSTKRNKGNVPNGKIFKNSNAEAAYKDIEAAFSEAIDDCYARFFTNLPVNLLEDAIHLYFQIQAAYWWYEDMWYDKYSHVLPKLSLRVFGQFVAEDCPILRHFVSSPEEHDKFLLNWKRYCKTIPLRGVILVNKDLTKCVLVKPWNGSRFMFPRGKMDEMEEDSLCAIREAYEELGIDVTKHLNDSLYIEKQVDEQTIKLFIIPGIDENTPLEPKKRKEISEIRWFNLSSLPNWQTGVSSSIKQRKTRNNDNLVHSENNQLIEEASEYISESEKQDLHLSDDDLILNSGREGNNLRLINNKSDSNQFFRVSQFTRNLRGWIEVLKKIPLENPNNPGGIISRLPKNLNPAVVRRLQNADLGGPPLSSLPLFVRVKGQAIDKRNQSIATAAVSVQNKKKSKPSISEYISRDKRTFGNKAGSGWDVEAMFALNEEKFGVKSTFSIDEYTIPLPKSKSRK